VRELVARAPVRIDFGGGWTDVPPYTTDHGGCVCSVAISRYARATLRDRARGVRIDEDGVERLAGGATELFGDGRKSLASVALARAGV
jgi:D-glycero-alpha-D-manno-heptose-7-phosphate kinase